MMYLIPTSCGPCYRNFVYLVYHAVHRNSNYGFTAKTTVAQIYSIGQHQILIQSLAPTHDKNISFIHLNRQNGD